MHSRSPRRQSTVPLTRLRGSTPLTLGTTRATEHRMPDQADALAGLEDRVAGLTFTLPLAPTGDGPAIACALGGAERSERADRRRSALAGATTRTSPSRSPSRVSRSWSAERALAALV